MNLDSEQALEARTMQLFAELGWGTANALHETFRPAEATATRPYLGRREERDVLLYPRLEAALVRLNPDLPAAALRAAQATLTQGRSMMAPVAANREVYHLLKDGVLVRYRDSGGHERHAQVRVIDWRTPAHNDFLIVQQLYIEGALHHRRPDLVGFVNGIPLLFGELKAHYRRLANAYNDNFRDYKDTIPQLFWYTGLVMLSNGSRGVVGNLSAPFRHFSTWKRVRDESERGVIALETLVRATCAPARLLDLVENYTLYHEGGGGLIKITAKNHQYLGVENVLAALAHIRQHEEKARGKLGVFWHTQGSGKSFSMIFLAQKILRTLGGHWTFVIVTDREDLDNQIYKNFARSGVVIEGEQQVRAQDGQHLKRLLRADHRYVFTLIQKFHTRSNHNTLAEQEAPYPVLSARDDIIVMVDEAHRSQYTVLAANMRRALPNAAYIGFTGTPLMAHEEERTREVFGDYVSVYNFKQSMDDGATVPLYYENRIPELQLTREDLNMQMADALDEAGVDEEEEAVLTRQFVREYHLITREDRLEKVAEDIVAHFVGRGYWGKAMVVAIDRLTAVKMYHKVQKYWQRKLEALRAQRDAPSRWVRSPTDTPTPRSETVGEQRWVRSPTDTPTPRSETVGEQRWVRSPTDTPTPWSETVGEQQEGTPRSELGGEQQEGTPRSELGSEQALDDLIAYMEETDMAVVISQSQNEIAFFAEHGYDIKPHRARMVNEDLDEKFKAPDDPFRLAFVCAMWRTGFDAPACSTIYLDRPMRNHTLMQTIARVNRVFGDKVNGLVVDYIGIFRELQQALTIYATGRGTEVGEYPIKDKDALVDALREALAEVEAFCAARGVDLDAILAAGDALAHTALMDAALTHLVDAQTQKALDDAVEQIIVNDTLKTRFFNLVTQVDRLCKAILPDPRAGTFAPRRRLLVKLVAKIRSLGPHVDAAALEPQVTRILDDAIQARPYVIHENGIQYDLSQVDFEKLRERFEQGRKRTEAEKLRGAVHAKIQRMVKRNPSRIDYQEAYQRLIDAYNAGARLGQANKEGGGMANGKSEGLSIEEFFTQLVELAQDLKVEEKRHIRENLTEEELAVFDILTRPAPELTKAEEARVKQTARDLLATLKREKLVLDWKKRQQYRAAVRLTIQNLLYERLPDGYSAAQCEQKRDEVYRHIYETYTSAEQHVYAEGYRYPAA